MVINYHINFHLQSNTSKNCFILLFTTVFCIQTIVIKFRIVRDDDDDNDDIYSIKLQHVGYKNVYSYGPAKTA
jgi:hypothetical protein